MNYSFTSKKLTKEDIPIAKVENSKQIIYLTEENGDLENNTKNKIVQFYDYLNSKSSVFRLSSSSEQLLLDAIKNDDITLLSNHDKKIYNQFNDYLKGDKHLYSDNDFEIIPNEKVRECLFISGQSNSGKSYFASKYMNNFNKLFPTSDIYLISSKNYEPAFEGLNIKQLDLNHIKDIVESGTPPYEFFVGKKQSLVVFDDVEGLEKKMEENVRTILKSILEVGRASRIYCICINHLLNNGFKTKFIINEATMVVVFPKLISHHNLKYYLESYLGFSKQQINKLLSLKSRWIAINKNPRYIIGKNDIILM